MTPEIEKRIKAVRAGRVPAGYKKSKVGIVPKEWEELKLSHYLTVSKEKNKDLQYSKDDVFSISGELGIVNQIELLGRSYAGESVAPYGIVKPNDIVYTKSPLKANPYGIIKTNKTGKAGIVSTLYAIFNCKNNVNPNFVQYYFESDKNLNDYLHPIVNIGAKHDMKISDENSLSGVVVFPPIGEQKKIAEILATQDRVIELKEKLIAEKQSQKKYLMSVLLGDDFKKPFKLNGVTIDKKKWEKVRCEKILVPSGKRNKENLNLEPYAITNEYGFVPQKQAHDDFGYMKNADRSAYIIVSSNSFGYNPARINVGSIGYYEGSEDIIVSSLYEVFKTTDAIDDRFLWHWFKSDIFPKWIDKLQEGSVRQYFYYDKLIRCEISLPSLPEQNAIADVLSAADEEISLLQKDLEQEKLKKKSLMQLLLTGLVRAQ